VPESHSRRTFLTRAGAAAGAVVATVGFPGGALASKRRRKRVYKLAPDGAQYHCGSAAKGTTGCSACKACHKHARNKLFANKAAAEKERHRAHRGCRCGVKRGRKLSREKWRELFHPKEGKELDVVDKRNSRVRRILNS
jgi:hypothetical protein